MAEQCNDHARGNTPRYTGDFPPRTDCPDCKVIYVSRQLFQAKGMKANPKAQVELEPPTQFSKLNTEQKRKILLGEGLDFNGYKIRPQSIVMFDIEATNLKANVGRILCCSFKPLGKEVFTYHALQSKFYKPDNHDDSALAVAIRDTLESYDIIVGWNSKNFDTKFINARAVRAGERTKKPQFHIDGMWSWRSKFAAWSGLDNVQKFAVPDGEQKTPIAWEKWMQAIGWDRTLRIEAMQEIITHCEQDVKVLEDVYIRMVDTDTIRSIKKDGGVL